MNNTSKREIEILDLQILTTILYIGTLLISIYITNVDRKSTINPNKNYPNTNKLSIFNRTFVFLLTLSFLYINYENRKLAIKKGEKVELFNLQIMASELTTLATIIVLYVVIKSSGQNYTIVSGVGNPSL
jgi:hypothetical protein